MKPNVKEFRHEKPLKEEISRLSEQGETKKDLYVMARDENLAKAIANQTNANQMDLKEDSLGSQAVNLFRNESKVIRHRFKELGFSQSEADWLDDKLEDGKLLLIIGDHKDPRGA